MSQHQTNIVVCGLIHRDGKIFVARRAKEKTVFPNQFELPGGHIDLDEDLKSALARELREELNLEVEVGQIADAFTYTSEGVLECEIIYLCKIVGEVQEPVLNSADHSEARWLSVDTIDDFEKNDEEKIALKRGFELLKLEAI